MDVAPQEYLTKPKRLDYDTYKEADRPTDIDFVRVKVVPLLDNRMSEKTEHGGQKGRATHPVCLPRQGRMPHGPVSQSSTKSNLARSRLNKLSK